MSTTTSKPGVEPKPPDGNYRAYIGSARRYDVVAAMVFNLLTCLGLRQQHRLIDIGCGSLRVGRLLIPYLNPGNYVGVEPNEWLVKEGIDNEVGQDLLRIKSPTLIIDTSLERLPKEVRANFAFAQSIFSHCGMDLMRGWLKDVADHLTDDGIFLATFCPGPDDFQGNGWVYPKSVTYDPRTMYRVAQEFGFSWGMLDWAHPVQTWSVYWRGKTQTSLFADGQVSWNRFLRSLPREAHSG